MTSSAPMRSFAMSVIASSTVSPGATDQISSLFLFFRIVRIVFIACPLANPPADGTSTSNAEQSIVAASPSRRPPERCRMSVSRFTSAASLAAVLGLAACTPTRDIMPPEPVAGERRFTVLSPQGHRIDPWYWLRDDTRSEPDVIAYLEAENAYYGAWESGRAETVETLNEELVGRLKQEDATVPVFERGYFYYTRFEEGQEHPIHARRKSGGEEEILLDGNAMAAGLDYFKIGDYAVSDDNRLLAWTEDTVGRRQYLLKVRDLQTGELLADNIRGISSFAWAADSRHLFYVENHPVTLLSYRVRRHELGSSGPDPIVYEESDNEFYTTVGRSRSGDYLAISLGSTEATEIRILEADDPRGAFRLFLARERGHLYTADHAGD